MIIIITGPSHVGKTCFAQKLMERVKYPYISIDHLKMGLIRSGNTNLTPDDDELLIGYLWPIVAEMIKTAVENNQNMIIEGIYVPRNWRESFNEKYLSNIKCFCLTYTKEYIEKHFDDIRNHANDIENRIDDSCFTYESLCKENNYFINEFCLNSEDIIYINDCYETKINELIEIIAKTIK